MMKRVILVILCILSMVNTKAQEGFWKGELQVQSIKLPLVFNFTDDGCVLDSPSQGVKGIKAEKTILDGNRINVAIPAIGATFEGEHCGDSICGTFKQNGMTLPLTLRPGEVETKRPQTPVPPFPYREEQIQFSNGFFPLTGH